MNLLENISMTDIVGYIFCRKDKDILQLQEGEL